MSDNQVSVKGLRPYDTMEIEWQGKPFNCMTCEKNDCCRVKDDEYKNQYSCLKCRCQAMYNPIKGTKKGKVISGSGKPFKCDSCDEFLSLEKCSDLGYLNNGLAQQLSIYDCSQNVVTTGDGNIIDNVEMKSDCNVGQSQGGGPRTRNVNNPSNTKYPLGLTANQFKITIIVVIVLILVLILF